MMRKAMARAAFASLALLLTAAGALGQGDNQRQSLNCDNQNNSYRNSRAQHCEVKEQTLPGGGAINVDGRQNGGIAVKGWDRSEVLVRYRIQTQGSTQAEADNLASQIRLVTGGGMIRAEGPEQNNDEQWSVSYEIFVPRRSDLSLNTHNGGISIADVRGRISFEARNGGVSLKRLGGNVTGETANGGLHVELGGNNWDGEGMDVRTSNGGLSISVPENYSAHLETGTVNGGLNVSPGIAEIARDTRQLSVNLGSGGATLRLHTTNGGISIKRRESR